VSEISRVIKKSGAVFITTPNLEIALLEMGRKDHIRHYSKDKLRDLLEPCFGSVVIKRRYYSAFFFTVDKYVPMYQKASGILKSIYFIIYVSLSFLYDLILLFERVAYIKEKRGGYNLYAVCRNPINPYDLASPCAGSEVKFSSTGASHNS
jgi:hypothetical protein